MKKIILLTMCMVLMGAGAAMAYDILNTTKVFDQYGHDAPWAGTPSHIGAQFITPGADFNRTSALLTLYTSWTPGGYSEVNTAYLFIDNNQDQVWDYAVDLEVGVANHAKTAMTVYIAPLSITYSSFPSGYWGKWFDSVSVDDSQRIPVKATSGSTTTADVQWLTGDNRFEVDLYSLVGYDKFFFFWGTGTCGNGPFSGSSDGKVPLPPSALLMGTGLLGLAGLGWRRKKNNV